MSAQNVWTCLTHYRHDSAKIIEKLFGNSLEKIIAALETYDDKDEYVGHASAIGKTDQGENASLKKDLDAAIVFLVKKGQALKAKEKDEDTPKPKGPDKVKMNSNTTLISVFTTIISAHEEAAEKAGKPVSVSKLQEALDKKAKEDKYLGTNWEGIKNVWNEYVRVYQKSKKGSKPAVRDWPR